MLEIRQAASTHNLIWRFTQPDSFIQDVFDPQMLNRYSYVRNNPLRYTDPSGHNIVDWFKGLFGNKNTPPTSTLSSKTIEKSLAKNTPISGGSGPVTLSNNNGTNPIRYTNESPITNYFKDVLNNGHIATEVSMSKGIVGGSGGYKFNNQGKTQYIAGAIPIEQRKTKTGGFRTGGSVLFSTNQVKESSLDTNLNIAFGLAAQFSYNEEKRNFEFEAWGFGCCGADVSLEYTGKSEPYSIDMSREISSRSKPLEQFYGQ